MQQITQLNPHLCDIDAPPGTVPGPDTGISSDTRMPSPPPHMAITIEAGYGAFIILALSSCKICNKVIVSYTAR